MCVVVDYLMMAGVRFDEWLLRPLWFIVAEYGDVPPIPARSEGCAARFVRCNLADPTTQKRRVNI
jgi:hypothetical protein